MRNLFVMKILGLITILNNFSQKEFSLIERAGKGLWKANGMVVILIAERSENIRDNCNWTYCFYKIENRGSRLLR